MIEQECYWYSRYDSFILLFMIFFCFKKLKIKAEIVLSTGGAYFYNRNFLHAGLKRNRIDSRGQDTH